MVLFYGLFFLCITQKSLLLLEQGQAGAGFSWLFLVWAEETFAEMKVILHQQAA